MWMTKVFAPSLPTVFLSPHSFGIGALKCSMKNRVDSAERSDVCHNDAMRHPLCFCNDSYSIYLLLLLYVWLPHTSPTMKDWVPEQPSMSVGLLEKTSWVNKINDPAD